MMKLNLTLGFTCCNCRQPVNVTVQCSGKGWLLEESESLAAVNVPCPTCGQVNRLQFDSGGQVRSVRPFPCFRVVPEPSVN